jgi:hypothetical protein
MTHAPLRRAFLAGSLAVPVAALPASPVDRVKDAGAILAEAMQARHGGQWHTIIDLDVGFAVTVEKKRTTAACEVVASKGGAA